jgi:hypothetical protein
MTRGRKAVLGAATVIFAGIIAGVVFTSLPPPVQSTSFVGAVIRQASDPKKQAPIAGAEIAGISGEATGECKSDSSGFFQLTLRPALKKGQAVIFKFRHSGYQALEMTAHATDQIYVARLAPISEQQSSELKGPQTTIANLRVRYSVKSTATANVGSIAKTFTVANKGDIRCNGRDPCSPDRHWKAAIGSASYDAEEGNEFRDVRVSCIAGPCPFTRIERNEFSAGGRKVKVSALTWSGTATFLVEADVVRTRVSDMIRYSFPIIFDNGMNFTLPATAEGPSIEADLNGSDIVFPLGPDMILSWASCTVKEGTDQSKSYRCELKPEYTFK